MADIITTKNGRLHIYVRQDKYKGKLKSENWVGRTFHNGKQKVISSGTTNSNRKYIPMTKASIMDCHLNAGKDMLSMYCNNFSSTNVFNGKGIMLGGSQNVKNDFVEGDLSAILLENLPFF